MNDQKIIPFLSFTGNAEEALNFYVSVVPRAKITSLVRYEKGQPHGDEGKVLNGTLSLMGQQFMFMDMPSANPAPDFSWATSFFMHCQSEAEFDAVFSGLAKEGSIMMGPEAVMQFRKVAWVTDQFGVTWQLVWQ
ncbi:VOC family protein [Lysinibacillus parviboronicapiens]|uniref:VOC family protein n=1 Tax=Lysinibacillus parviboronicapiens TaxID=436516 RepID=UPI0006D22883|nr:VOC family protein [Lysinibacillus parviboronicapiens]